MDGLRKDGYKCRCDMTDMVMHTVYKMHSQKGEVTQLNRGGWNWFGYWMLSAVENIQCLIKHKKQLRRRRSPEQIESYTKKE